MNQLEKVERGEAIFASSSDNEQSEKSTSAFGRKWTYASLSIPSCITGLGCLWYLCCCCIGLITLAGAGYLASEEDSRVAAGPSAGLGLWCFSIAIFWGGGCYALACLTCGLFISVISFQNWQNINHSR